MTTAETTTTDGLLIATSGDLNVSIGGSATYSFGDGYTTETLKGDSAHKVDAGKYTLKASGDIDMTTPADINLSAYDMSVTLSGSDSITVEGTSTKSVGGSTTTNAFSTSTTIIHGDTTIVSFSASFSMSMSISLSLSGAATTSISLGFNVSIQLGAAVKVAMPYNITLVLGTDYKYVNGPSLQYTNKSEKFVKNADSKTSTTDSKVAYIEFKYCNSSIDRLSKEQKGVLTEEGKKMLENLKSDVHAEYGVLQSDIVDMYSLM